MKKIRVKIVCSTLLFSLVSGACAMDNLVSDNKLDNKNGRNCQLSGPKDKSSSEKKVYEACQRKGMIFNLCDFEYKYPIENQLFGCKITLQNKYTKKKLEFFTKRNDQKTKELAREKALEEVYETLMKPLIEAWDKAEDALNRRPGSLDEATVKGLSSEDIKYIFTEQDEGKFCACVMKINDSPLNLIGKGMTKEEAQIDVIQKFCRAYGEWINEEIAKDMDNILRNSTYVHTMSVDGIVIKNLGLKDVTYKYEEDQYTGRYTCGIKIKGNLLFFSDGWFSSKSAAKKNVIQKFNDIYGVWLRGDLKKGIYEFLKIRLDESEVEKILVKELGEVLRKH